MKNISSLAIAVSLWLACIIGCVPPSDRNTSSPSANPGQDSYELELLSYRGERSYDYLIVEGQVRNISGEKLQGVMAVAECYDGGGNLVTSEDAVLEYDPIMPGQTSPFKVMVRDNPLIKTFRVNFKHIFGETIQYKDSTSTETPKSRNKKK